MATQYTRDTFRGFDEGFVDGVLTLMLTDVKFMRKYGQLLSPDLFGDTLRITLAELARRYYDQSGLVAKDMFLSYIQDAAEDERMNESRVKLLKGKGAELVQEPTNAYYISQKLERFFQFAKLKRLQIELGEAIEAGNIDAAAEAVSRAQAIQKDDLERPVEYFTTVNKRILRRILESKSKDGVRFMVPTLEKYGIFAHRDEICLCIAPSKRGKSIFLQHAGKCAILQGHNVLHVSLENSRAMVEDRYDSMFSNMEKDELTPFMDKLGNQIGYLKELFKSKLYILWRMARTYSPQDLQNDIQQLARDGVRIDVVIVDYGELMKSSVRGGDAWMRASRDEIFTTARAVAQRENVVLITAQQTPLKRRKQFRIYMEDGQESSMPAQHSSLILTLNQTPEEYDNNEMRLYVDGYWHGPAGQKVGDILLKQDFSRMQFCLHEMRLSDGVAYAQNQAQP